MYARTHTPTFELTQTSPRRQRHTRHVISTHHASTSFARSASIYGFRASAHHTVLQMTVCVSKINVLSQRFVMT